MCISIPVYRIYLQVLSNLHTHSTHTCYFFVWGCNVFCLKRGRQNELGRYGMNMNHMIALESLESSFLRQIYYYYIYFYFGCTYIIFANSSVLSNYLSITLHQIYNKIGHSRMQIDILIILLLMYIYCTLCNLIRLIYIIQGCQKKSF